MDINQIITARATELLASYDEREGLTQQNSIDGTWDLKQAARLAEQLRECLRIINEMQPADDTLRSAGGPLSDGSGYWPAS